MRFLVEELGVNSFHNLGVQLCILLFGLHLRAGSSCSALVFHLRLNEIVASVSDGLAAPLPS